MSHKNKKKDIIERLREKRLEKQRLLFDKFGKWFWWGIEAKARMDKEVSKAIDRYVNEKKEREMSNSKVNEILEEISKKEGIKILYAAEVGGRQWGYSAIDSDYDVRFIYKRPISYYLRIANNDGADHIEEKLENGKFDIVGWDIKKFLIHIFKGNASVIEWLIADLIYIDNGVKEELRTFSEKYFNHYLAIHHYRGIANTNFIGRAKIKNYLLACRAILIALYIAATHLYPLLNFEDLLKLIFSRDPIVGMVPYLSPTIFGVIRDLFYRKKKGEIETDNISALDVWIKENMAWLNTRENGLTLNKDANELHEYFMNQVMKN